MYLEAKHMSIDSAESKRLFITHCGSSRQELAFIAEIIFFLKQIFSTTDHRLSTIYSLKSS